MNAAHPYRPSHHDLRAGFLLATSITGRRSAARRVVRHCSNYNSAETFLLEVRRRALTSGATGTLPPTDEPPDLLPAEQVSDPRLGSFLHRWCGLSDEEQRAAWNALCGRPFQADVFRSAVDRLDVEDYDGFDAPRDESIEPEGNTTGSLPADEDIP